MIAQQQNNAALCARIAAGDTAASGELVNAIKPLVHSRVLEFLKRRPQHDHLKDDLEGEAFLALARVVNMVREKGTPLVFEQYVISAIDRAIQTCADKAPVFGPGHSRLKTARRKRGVIAQRGVLADLIHRLYGRLIAGDYRAVDPLVSACKPLAKRAAVLACLNGDPQKTAKRNANLRFALDVLFDSIHALVKPHQKLRSIETHVFNRMHDALASGHFFEPGSQVESQLPEEDKKLETNQTGATEFFCDIHELCDSDRQRDIVSLAAQYELPDKQLAGYLGCSTKTIQRERNNLERKLCEYLAA